MLKKRIPTGHGPRTEEDTRPKGLIRAQWRKVLYGYLRDASSQLERDQCFINEQAQQLVV